MNSFNRLHQTLSRLQEERIILGPAEGGYLKITAVGDPSHIYSNMILLDALAKEDAATVLAMAIEETIESCRAIGTTPQNSVVTPKVKKLVEFRGKQCRVEFAEYSNGRIAIRLVIDETGEPMATASMNLVDEDCKPTQTFIKDYSENSGILDVLLNAGVVRDTGATAISGFCEYRLVDVVQSSII